ncbi:MAG: rRNA maturation RNase YbeY [Ferruginibacter sp.]
MFVSNSLIKCCFQYAGSIFFLENISLINRSALKEFIIKLFKAKGKKLDSMTYIFCSDEYLLDINKANLKHDYYTDIITFNLSPDPNIITGEVYISIDRVRDNATELKVSLKEELHRVIFHGVLHLCGHKDKSAKDTKEMRAAEDRLLAKYLKS